MNPLLRALWDRLLPPGGNLGIPMTTHHPPAMTHPTSDPWAHRSEGMRCKSCMWFVPKHAADGITDLGRCRRHAPTGMGFPPVFVNDWCGDHRLDENRAASINRPGHESLQADVRSDLLKKELSHYKSAFEELRRENETLSLALDRMTDKAVSRMGTKS